MYVARVLNVTSLCNCAQRLGFQDDIKVASNGNVLRGFCFKVVHVFVGNMPLVCMPSVAERVKSGRFQVSVLVSMSLRCTFLVTSMLSVVMAACILCITKSSIVFFFGSQLRVSLLSIPGNAFIGTLILDAI